MGLMSPLPDLNQAYAMLLQDENQRNHVQPIALIPEHAAMNARFTHNNSQKRQNSFRKDEKKNHDVNVECGYCHMSGHSRDKCFALHGYPEWHRLYGKPKPKIRTASAKQSVANVTTEIAKPDLVVSNVSASTDELSESQCQQLIQMLQSRVKTPNAPWLNNNTNHVAGMLRLSTNSVIFASPVQFVNHDSTWILDSGATHHITPFIHLVSDLKANQSELHLPNGDVSSVTHIGTIHLSDHII